MGRRTLKRKRGAGQRRNERGRIRVSCISQRISNYRMKASEKRKWQRTNQTTKRNKIDKGDRKTGNYDTERRVKNLLRIPPTASRRTITEPRKFAQLARQFGWVNADETVWPVSLNNLLRYIAFSHHRGNQPATISTYLSTLARVHVYKGHFEWKNKIRMHPVVRSAMQNLRAHHHFPTIKQKSPITTGVLEQIKNRCDLEQPHHALFWCIATVAFHTLSRIGELVVTNQQ